MKSQGSVVSKAIKRVFGIHLKLFYEGLDIYYNILSRDVLLAGFRNFEGNQHWIHASKHKYLTLPSKRKNEKHFRILESTHLIGNASENILGCNLLCEFLAIA